MHWYERSIKVTRFLCDVMQIYIPIITELHISCHLLQSRLKSNRCALSQSPSQRSRLFSIHVIISACWVKTVNSLCCTWSQGGMRGIMKVKVLRENMFSGETRRGHLNFPVGMQRSDRKCFKKFWLGEKEKCQSSESLREVAGRLIKGRVSVTAR